MDSTTHAELREDAAPTGAPVSAVAPPRSGTDWFTPFFHEVFPKLHRFLTRYADDADVASETAQEAFVRLYRRRPPPENPEAWVFTVSMNLVRNLQSRRSRRHRLLTPERSIGVLADPPAPPSAAAEGREDAAQVRRALARLSDREQRLLLLRAEGYSYLELARVLALNESSVGTMLKRAKEAFIASYAETTDAP